MTFPPIDPDNTALFLDVDGTLLEIVDNPADVVADASLVAMLKSIETGLGGALALVSGRTLEELDRIFSPASFAVAGTHGSELRLPDGRIERSTSNRPPDTERCRLQAFVERNSGLLLEVKDTGMALHYRRAPGLEDEARQLILDVVDRLGPAFRLIDGKKVLEIVPCTHDKGAALRRFMRHPVYADRVPVFIGDDVTDEDGFLVINELEGISVKVGNVGETAANYSMPDVGAVRQWLEQVLKSL